MQSDPSRSTSDAKIASMARLRYPLFLLVALLPFAAVGSVKLAPRALAATLFVVHAALSAVSRGRERSLPRDLLSALLLLGCFGLSAIVAVGWLALVVAPPVTSDGHPVMPIGQALIGIVGGGILGAALSYAALRPRWRNRDRERLVLHAIGAVLVVAAILRWTRE